MGSSDEIFFTLQILSHRQNFSSLSLLYPYFHGKCFNEIHSLVIQVQNIKSRTAMARTQVNIILIPLILHSKKEVQSSNLFHQKCHFVNRIPNACFLDHYHVTLFKSRSIFIYLTYPHNI